MLILVIRFRRNILVSACYLSTSSRRFFCSGHLVYRNKNRRGCAAEMYLLKHYFPLKNIIVIYQSIIIHIMSKKKSIRLQSIEIIFKKDVYKTDYVLEFFFLKTITITMPNMNARFRKALASFRSHNANRNGNVKTCEITPMCEKISTLPLQLFFVSAKFYSQRQRQKCRQ